MSAVLPLLFVDHAHVTGGAEHSLLLLLRHMDRRRWVPHLACVEGEVAAAARSCGVQVHIVPIPRVRGSFLTPIHLLQCAKSLGALARQIQAHVVIANTVRSALYVALSTRRKPLRAAWYMRDFWLSEEEPSFRGLDRLIKRYLCHRFDAVIANSHATAEMMPYISRTVVVSNGIDLGEFRREADGLAFRRRHGIPAGAPLIGCMGRLRPWKGQDRFLRAMLALRERAPQAWGVVVGGAIFGDTRFQKALHRMAEEMGLAGRVIFTGYLTDVSAALAAMDIFVHPGDPEPFGLVNIEAMAMRKPVVAFAHGALPEIVIDQETGILVPPADELALVEAIVYLMDHPDVARRMGLAGRRRVEEHFTIDKTVESFQAVLQQLSLM